MDVTARKISLKKAKEHWSISQNNWGTTAYSKINRKKDGKDDRKRLCHQHPQSWKIRKKTTAGDNKMILRNRVEALVKISLGLQSDLATLGVINA